VQAELDALDARAKAVKSPNKDEDLGLRAARVASKAVRAWPRFGFFLPSHAKETSHGPDLAEHCADFFEELATAGSRWKQDWLILHYTIAVVAKVLACAGVAFRRRLLDEFTSLKGLASGRGMESPSSTPRD
jgi:hypothetical protein